MGDKKYYYKSIICEAEKLDDELYHIQHEEEVDSTICPAWEVVSITPIIKQCWNADAHKYVDTTKFVVVYRIEDEEEQK